MAGVLEQVAQGITDALNGATTLSREFTAEHSFADWQDLLKDVDRLHVDVVPFFRGVTELFAQKEIQYVVPVDVAVRQRFASDQDRGDGRIPIAKVYELIELVEEIGEFFHVKRLANFDAAVWDETEVRVWYSRRDLRELRQYTGIVRVTHLVHKDLP